MKRRIGILTSGGDCQGLNAAMRGVAKALYEYYKNEVEIYGIEDGYKGLIYNKAFLMDPKCFSGILNRGGTILGTSRQPFKLMQIPDKDGLNKLQAMKDTYKKLKLDCIAILGGNGTQKTANLLSEEGLNVVSLPKTIDNDLWGTDMTFGFQSAVDVATRVIDGIHTTATSHGRVFIIELMGHKTGWLTLHAGISGGADVILIPEIPYSIEKIVKSLKNREKQGKKFSIIAVAEGAISKKEVNNVKKNKKEKSICMVNPAISYKIAEDIAEVTHQEVRVTVPGHYQRGGEPCAYDRVLASRFGTKAANLIINKNYGKMVVVQNNKITSVKLSSIAGKLKKVPKDSPIIKTAKDMGINFGD